LSAAEMIAVTFALFFGGLVKGAIGFGLPVFTNSILFVFMAPQKVVVLMSIPILLTNLLNVLIGWKEWPNFRHVIPCFLAGFASVPAGVYFLSKSDPGIIRIFLAGVVFVYLGVHRRIPKMESFDGRIRTALGVVFGLAVGFTMGATDITGPVHGIYLAMFLWPKEIFIFVINAFNALTAASLSGTLLFRGEYTLTSLSQIRLAMIPIASGFFAGMFLRGRISQQMFYRMVRGILFCIAVSLTAVSVWSWI
jgi:uncharacterized membrane protein YfcA